MSNMATIAIETNASLRILGEDLDPDQVTNELGLQPDESHRKGDVIGKRTPLPHKRGYWSIVSSRHMAASAETNDHLRWLVASVEPRLDVLRSYQKRGWLVDLWLGLHSAAGHGGPTLAP